MILIAEEKEACMMKPSKSYFSRTILILWCLFIIFIFLRLRENFVHVFIQKDRHIRLVEITVMLAIISEALLFKKFFHKWCDKRKGIFLFIIAFVVRLFFLQFSEYVPSGDFANYFYGACQFSEGGLKAGAYKGLWAYGIPSFGGQAIINGLLLRVLSPTLLGMQILNSIYTSGICLLIYLLGKGINEKSAIIGSILYTFYPANILATQITSNHHGATFFMLLSIYLFSLEIKNKKLSSRLILLVACAICLVISNYYHPSTILTICAFLAYMIMYELDMLIRSPKTFLSTLGSEIKRAEGIFVSVFIVLLMYFILYKSSLAAITQSGYIDSKKLTPISKIVVGFNFEFGGAYNGEDGIIIKSVPEEEQTALCINLIRERLSEHSIREILGLMIRKTERAWFDTDNYFFSAYQGGKQTELAEKIEAATDPVLKISYEKQLNDLKYNLTDIYVTDVVFIYSIWLLAIAGMFVIAFQYQQNHILYLLMYIPLGWMAFIMITEMQPRYRYQGMTVVILMAGFGLQAIREKINKLPIRNREDKNGKF